MCLVFSRLAFARPDLGRLLPGVWVSGTSTATWRGACSVDVDVHCKAKKSASGLQDDLFEPDQASFANSASAKRMNDVVPSSTVATRTFLLPSLSAGYGDMLSGRPAPTPAPPPRPPPHLPPRPPPRAPRPPPRAVPLELGCATSALLCVSPPATSLPIRAPRERTRSSRDENVDRWRC